MNDLDWSRFTVRINIKADRSTLYDAWSTRAGMEYWFLRTCEYVDTRGYLIENEVAAQPGYRYTFQWHGYPDDIKEQGEILEANGHDVFSFRFGRAGVCTVRLLLAGNEQIVELVQDQIPTDEKSKIQYHVGCKTGWTFHLTNLKSLYEGGIDLRNRDENLLNMLNS